MKRIWYAIISLFSAGKGLVQLITKKAEKAKLTSIDLASGFRKVGEDCFANRKHDEDFRELFHQLDNIERKLAALDSDQESQTNRKSLKEKVVATTNNALKKATLTKLSLQKSSLFGKLGREVFEKYGLDNASTQFGDKIQKPLEKIAQLEIEIFDLSKHEKGNWITPKRLAIVVSGATICVFLALSTTRKSEADTGEDESSGWFSGVGDWMKEKIIGYSPREQKKRDEELDAIHTKILKERRTAVLGKVESFNSPGKGRVLQSEVNTENYAKIDMLKHHNGTIKSLKCSAREGVLTIEFDVDVEKWKPVTIVYPIFVRLLDKDRLHITHFQTNQGFTAHKYLADDAYDGVRISWPECTSILLLKPSSNRLAFKVDASDLEEATFVEISFADTTL
jgi:hypothetical protein